MTFPEGKISYSPRNVLRLDNEIIETSVIQPAGLHDFVIASADTISDRVEDLYERDRARGRNPALLERVVIHTARLALNELDHSVLSTLRRDQLQGIAPDPHLLPRGVKPYWDAVVDTRFIPEVHIRSANSQMGTSGVWLSLRTPHQQ